MTNYFKKISKTEYYLTNDSGSDILVVEQSLTESENPHFFFPELNKALPSILSGKVWWSKEAYWIKFPSEIETVIQGIEWIDDDNKDAYRVSFIATFLFSELFSSEKKLGLFLFSLFRIFLFSEIILDKRNNEVRLSIIPPMSPLNSYMTLQPEFWDMVENAKLEFINTPFYFINHSKVFKMKVSEANNRLIIKFSEDMIKPPPYRENNFIIWLLRKLFRSKV